MTNESATEPVPNPQDEEPPPILGTWPRLYTAVLLHLAFWILIFYLFTVRFDYPE